jgi:predicted O-linked N-acetylglucosamine transferase (SPINDLY family)
VLNGPVRTKESLGLDPKKTSYVCPQTSFKFHPAFDEALSGILEADPEGELVVMEGRVPAWTEAVRRRWERVLPDGLQRVRFLRSMPQPEFLHLLASADVVLDPYPFCGGNSSYEALAVGTPVITYPSPYLRGRLTDAMYRRMEWTDLVASSPTHYIQLAAELGRDQVRNRSARETIRSLAGILFNNNEDILAWENLFHQWLGETS